jgi:hypothetical protein
MGLGQERVQNPLSKNDTSKLLAKVAGVQFSAV